GTSSWREAASVGGRATGAVMPIASAYRRYVSMEATTMRASTVIRSIPTSETRTHASMTMPLSSTRSRTSIRLVPPGARSTGGMGQFTSFVGGVDGGAPTRWETYESWERWGPRPT